MLLMYRKQPEAAHLSLTRTYHHGAAFKEGGVLMRYCKFCNKKMEDEEWQAHLVATKHYSFE